MRTLPEDNYDKKDLARLNAAPWMVETLKYNPDYVFWGPHEDYMWTKDGGWNSAVIKESWKDFGPWELTDYNECVNFYFQIARDAKKCPTCQGNGYHPKAQKVVNSFYAHMNPEGEHWNDKITQDEVDALIAAGRLKPGAQAGAVNLEQRSGFGHDAINRHILIEARLKRLGLPETCPECEGQGSLFTEPAAHLNLVLWFIHPRKGASRGIEIKRIEQSELPAVFAYLQKAALRNAARFAKLPKEAQ